MLSVAVLVSGRGTNLQALLEAEREEELGPASIDVVISDDGDATALDRAKSFGVETVFVDPDGKDQDAFEAELVDALTDREIDLVVLAGFMRILSSRFLSAFPQRVINIHPSLLPSFRGLDAQQQAIDAGVRVAGATTHFVAEDVDAGPIILQSAVPVDPDDDRASLSQRILDVEHEILPASVRLYAEGRLSIEEGRVQIKGPYEADGIIRPEVASDG